MRIYFLLLFFFFGGYELIMASDQLISTGDTVKINQYDLSEQKMQDDVPILYGLDLGITGLYINETFGTHPILDFCIDKYNHRNTYKIVYEARFGHSKNEYQILDNDTLKSTNAFKGKYLGFEYERMLIMHPYQEVFGIIGIGYDWIWIPKKNAIRNNHIIGGLGLNMGIRYCPYIRKKHGPNVCLFYHFADFNNKGGSSLSNNSVVIRVSYNFGRLSTKW